MEKGIVNPGRKERRICEACKKQFEASIGVITIKGPMPEPLKCNPCEKKFQQQIMANLENLFKARRVDGEFI